MSVDGTKSPALRDVPSIYGDARSSKGERLSARQLSRSVYLWVPIINIARCVRLHTALFIPWTVLVEIADANDCLF